MLANILVPVLASMLNAFIVAVVCSPIVYVCSLGIKREYSLDFWLRSVLLGQFLFWGALILDASATQYGYFKDVDDVVKVFFNFLISVPATALMIRTSMRIRKSKKPDWSDADDPKDGLDQSFAALKGAKSVTGKVAKTLSK